MHPLQRRCDFSKYREYVFEIAPCWSGASTPIRSVYSAAGAKLVAAALALLCAGCFGFLPRAEEPLSFGFPEDGFLRNGIPMPTSGEGFVLARPGDDTRYGLPPFVRALERAARAVARTYPGGAPLRVGDLSAPFGGQHPRHHSHRSGRDVDLIFYVTDLFGASVSGNGALRFEEHGVVADPREPGRRLVFDDARNWLLVRTLLTDPEVFVQWVFCSQGVKARLLRYAADHETDPDVLFAATWLIHEPTNAREHDDHFHIRVACTAIDRAAGCVDRAPIWTWIRRDVEKPADPAPSPLSDEVLVRALLEDPSADEIATAVAPTSASAAPAAMRTRTGEQEGLRCISSESTRTGSGRGSGRSSPRR